MVFVLKDPVTGQWYRTSKSQKYFFTDDLLEAKHYTNLSSVKRSKTLINQRRKTQLEIVKIDNFC